MGARMGNVALLQMKAMRNAEPPLCSAFRNQPGSSACSSSISCSAHAAKAASSPVPSELTSCMAKGVDSGAARMGRSYIASKWALKLHVLRIHRCNQRCTMPG